MREQIKRTFRAGFLFSSKKEVGLDFLISAPGNVFFFGEHSVVYQRWAILASIDKKTYCRIHRRADERVYVSSEGYGRLESSVGELSERRYSSWGDYTYEMDPLRDLIGYFFREVQKPAHGFALKIKSEIPKKSGGMSSSTAVLCSVFKALDVLYNFEQIPNEEYFDHLYPFQVKIHGGAASVSEITSSSMGGYNKFKLDKSGEIARPLYENLGKYSYHLVIGDTGKESKTSKAVRMVRKQWQKNPTEFEGYFSEIECLARQGEEALLSGKPRKVGELMNENHRILSEKFEVSSPELEVMIEDSRKAGAYGAKLSGAGTGGSMIALVSEETQEDVAAAIRETGKNTTAYRTKVGVDGARMEEKIKG